jgi:hypothetical protein
LSRTLPEKTAVLQITRIPPDAPADGMKSKLSKCRGANFLMCFDLSCWLDWTVDHGEAGSKPDEKVDLVKAFQELKPL